MLPLGVVKVSPVKAQALYLRKAVLLWRDGLSAGQRNRRASVIPMLEGLGNLQGLAWNSVDAGSDVSGVGHGDNKRQPTLGTITEPVVQSPSTARPILLLRAKGPFAPNGEA